MWAECPKCGEHFLIKVGRPDSNINCQKVFDNLRKTHSVKKTAEELECSTGHIYNLMKARGIDPKDITHRKYKRKEKQSEN